MNPCWISASSVCSGSLDAPQLFATAQRAAAVDFIRSLFLPSVKSDGVRGGVVGGGGGEGGG